MSVYRRIINDEVNGLPAVTNLSARGGVKPAQSTGSSPPLQRDILIFFPEYEPLQHSPRSVHALGFAAPRQGHASHRSDGARCRRRRDGCHRLTGLHKVQYRCKINTDAHAEGVAPTFSSRVHDLDDAYKFARNTLLIIFKYIFLVFNDMIFFILITFLTVHR